MLHPSNHLGGPPLDLLQKVHVLPVLGIPGVDAVFQVGSQQSTGLKSPPSPAAHTALDAAQVASGLLGCECTLPAHVQPLIQQHPHILLGRAALEMFIPQPLLIPGVAQPRCSTLHLALLKPHVFHMAPLLRLVQVTLGAILSFRCVRGTAQIGVTCRFAEGALYPFIHVINKDDSNTGPSMDP